MTVNIDLDTEFLEDGRTIELISLALVADGGYHLYLINQDAPLERIVWERWLMTHVVPSLPLRYTGDRLEWDPEHPDFERVQPRAVIASRVKEFVGRFACPKLWADHGAYDHVVLAQLFGRMVDLPAAVPMWTADVRQEWDRLGRPRLPEQPSGEHHALEDARHIRRIREYLAWLEEKRKA